MEPSSQDGEDAEASTPLNPHQDSEGPFRKVGSAPASRWLFYLKPIVVMAVGALLFGLGTALSLFYFSHVGTMPYLLAPLFLSVGLVFLVASLVWIPMIKPLSQ